MADSDMAGEIDEIAGIDAMEDFKNVIEPSVSLTNTYADMYRTADAFNPLENASIVESGRYYCFTKTGGRWAPEEAIQPFMGAAADQEHPLADLPAGWLKGLLHNAGIGQRVLMDALKVGQSAASKRVNAQGRITTDECRAILAAIYETLNAKAQGTGDYDLVSGYLGYLRHRIHERNGSETREAEDQEIRLISESIRFMAERLDMEGLLALHTMAMRLASGRRNDFRLTVAQQTKQKCDLEELWPKVTRAQMLAWQLAACHPSDLGAPFPFDEA